MPFLTIAIGRLVIWRIMVVTSASVAASQRRSVAQMSSGNSERPPEGSRDDDPADNEIHCHRAPRTKHSGSRPFFTCTRV
jgi:hypothetical protein